MSHDHSSRFAGLAGELTGDDDTTPPIVLLHGLTYDRRNWEPTMAELRRLDPARRVLALDLPGHGQSRGTRGFGLEQVAVTVHAATDEAGLRAPVMVGHSAGAIVATIYAAAWSTSGVVNVDQPLEVGDFAAHLRTKTDQLHGPDYGDVWDELRGSLRIDLLPPAAQDLLWRTSTPRQDLFLGYWADVLDGDLAALDERIDTTLAALRAIGVPYTYLAGGPVDPVYGRWMHERLPDAAVLCWPGSGHFVHLAHPHRFAQLLASTAAWPSASAVMVC
jgi:pimeloyl-ACP methyl ester carboxylesterase